MQHDLQKPMLADLHEHVLWGIDDGPATAEEMRAMLECAVQEGIGVIAATSHAYPRERAFDMALYQERLQEANELCQREGWPLQLVSGCEIYYSARVPDLLAAGKLPTLGKTRNVLIEFPYKFSMKEIEQAANRIYQAGFCPIAAHVERYRVFARSAEQAMAAHEGMGVLFQMNSSTMLHPRGFFQRRFVRRMLEAGAIDLVATDAHDTKLRPIRLRAAYEHLQTMDEDMAADMNETAWRVLGMEMPQT